LSLAVQTGREENLELVTATQLPHKINASITGQSTELVCFRLTTSTTTSSGEYLLEVIMRRYENKPTIMTSNRLLEE